MLRQIECIISGRVQGVLYRDFARRKARQNGLVGMVENLPDKTVHIIAQGSEPKLHAFIEELKRGSLFSRVDAVDIDWSNAAQAFPDFRIKYQN